MSLNNDEEQFKFVFEDESELLVPKNAIIEISPSFYFKNINKIDNNIIKMPKYIGYSDLDNFIKLFQKYISRLRQFNFDESFISIKILLENYSTNIAKFIQISEYFDNNSFSIILIKDCILTESKDNENSCDYNHRMNIDNVIILLYISYNKLKDINNQDKTIINKNNIINIEEELESTWLDLFIKSLEVIGKNLNYYFENDNETIINNKLWGFDKKIIDELYEKFSYNLIMRNYLINSNDEIELESNSYPNYIEIKELKRIINFLIKKRNQNDFFSLLSNEFMKIISEENINELNSLPNPTFILKININDISNYYEEYPICNSINMNNNHKIIIVVYYKKNEDTFNVALKLSKDRNDKINTSFDIVTFLSLTMIEEINNKQIHVKSLSPNKSMYDILKITNFTKIISDKEQNQHQKNEYLTLKLFLKPCYIYTLLSNYLFYDLENLYNNKNIPKLPKNLLNIIIQKKQLNKNDDIDYSSNETKNNNTDKIVNFLINWLDDEINIGEDISEIIKNIKWEYVSLPLIIEFLIKYSGQIMSDDIEFIFCKSLTKILNKFDGNINLLSQEIIHSIVASSKQINYISLFCENKKMKKFNLYEFMNQKRNLSLKLNNNDKNDISFNINNISDNNSNTNNINIENKNGNNINNIKNFYVEKINKNDINNKTTKNKSVSKENIFYSNNKNKENKIKVKEGNSKSPININNKLVNNSKNKNNISYINNNNICYNNYFTNCNNNFNIKIKLNDKIKKIISDNNKKKVIISQIKINSNSIKKNKKINNNNNTITPNKNYLNKTYFYTPKIKVKIDKCNVNGENLNKTINFKNLKNFDKLLMKNKIDKNKNRNKSVNYKHNSSNYSEYKNKTYIHDEKGEKSFYNYKKLYPPKDNKDNIENKKIKNNKNIKHISLINELLKMNKKGKNQNILEMKKNINTNNIKINKQNLTQINIDKKLLKDNI